MFQTGEIPRDTALSFKRHLQPIKDLVADMIARNPERVVLVHGRWYKVSGTSVFQKSTDSLLISRPDQLLATSCVQYPWLSPLKWG